MTTLRCSAVWVVCALCLGPPRVLLAEADRPIGIAKLPGLAREGKFELVLRSLEASGLADGDRKVADLVEHLSRFVDQRAQQAKKTRALYRKRLSSMIRRADAERWEDALDDAIEAHEYAADREAMLRLASVQSMAGKAEAAAAEALGREHWLEALSLYHRLKLLYENHASSAYTQPADRIRQKVRLLALYAPDQLQRLHEERARALGEDSQPMTGRDNLSWETQLDGVTRAMLVDALEDAAEQHMSRQGYATLVDGAIDAMLVMLDTKGLSETFPSLAEAPKVDQFRGQLLALGEEVAKPARRLRRRQAVRIIDQILSINAHTIALPERVVIYELAEGAMETLDQFSSVIWPYEKAQFGRSTKGNFPGVGITISQPMPPLTVRQVIAGSPAAAVGIRQGDMVLSVNGEDTTTKTLRWAARELEDPSPGKVALTVAHQDPNQHAQYHLEPDVGLRLERGPSRLTVVSPMWGTPAHEAGIKPKDVIVKVEGQDTTSWSLRRAVHEITGPTGTVVHLTIQRQGEDHPIEVALKRGQIEVPSIMGWQRTAGGGWTWFIDRDNHIGYIRLSQFIPHTPTNLDAAINQMDRDGGLRALILDLRSNPGGLLPKSVEVANRFVGAGKIVSTVDRWGKEGKPLYAKRHLAHKGFEMVVLINQSSASASEIVAGALQDYHRAVIVGTRSYGKGSVQDLFYIGNNKAQLKLTTQYFKLPGGRIIHRRPQARDWGIQPDLEVRMTRQQIAEALALRRNLDVLIEAPDDRDSEGPRAQDILQLGLDPQLETALLILKIRLVCSRINLARAPVVNGQRPVTSGQ